MKQMKLRAVITMLTAWAIVMSSLSPLMVREVSAQTKTAVVEGELDLNKLRKLSPDDPAYYRSPNVRFLSMNFNKAQRADFTYLVGSSPQIRGGAKTQPQADEEDVPNDRVRDIETMSKGMTLSIVKLPTEMPVRDAEGKIVRANGKVVMEPVMVRQKKGSGQLLMVLKCANWSREVGYDPIPPQPIDNTCRDFNPNPTPTANRNDKGEIISYSYDFGCGNKATVAVEVRKEKEVCNCTPGSYTPTLFNRGKGDETANVSNIASMKELKSSPAFTVKEALIARFGEATMTNGKDKDWELILREMDKFKQGIADVRLKYLYLEVDLCPTAAGTNNVLFHAIADDDQPPIVKKRNWGKILKWVIPIIVTVAIILIVRGGGGLKKPIPIPPRITPP